MKTRTFGFLTAVALVALAGCEKEAAPEVSHTYTFTIEATKAGESDTKALFVDGSSLVSTWGSEDLVYVFNRTTGAFLDGVVRPVSSDYGKTTATLTGTLSGTVSAGNNLKLYVHQKGNIDFQNQNGSLSSLSNSFDVSTGFATVKSVDGSTIVPETATTFTSEQAVVKFVFKDKSGERIYPTSLKLDIQNASGDHYIQRWAEMSGDPEGVLELTGINPSTTADGVYVAIRVRPDDDMTPITKIIFEAEDGNFKYTGEVAGRITFQNGKYYVRNVTFKKNATYVGAETLLSSAQKDKHLGWVVDKDAKIYPPEAVKNGSVDAKAVIVYFDDANHGVCMAREDAGTARSHETAAGAILSDWNTNRPVAGHSWYLPTKDDWSKVWKYRMVNLGETGAVFPVKDLLSAVDASLAVRPTGDVKYWTSSAYHLNESTFFVFKIWDFEGRHEDDYSDWGFVELYDNAENTLYIRYFLNF